MVLMAVILLVVAMVLMVVILSVVVMVLLGGVRAGCGVGVETRGIRSYHLLT